MFDHTVIIIGSFFMAISSEVSWKTICQRKGKTSGVIMLFPCSALIDRGCRPIRVQNIALLL